MRYHPKSTKFPPNPEERLDKILRHRVSVLPKIFLALKFNVCIFMSSSKYIAKSNPAVSRHVSLLVPKCEEIFSCFHFGSAIFEFHLLSPPSYGTRQKNQQRKQKSPLTCPTLGKWGVGEESHHLLNCYSKQTWSLTSCTGRKIPAR